MVSGLLLPVGAGTAFAEEDVFCLAGGGCSMLFNVTCCSSFLGFHLQLLQPTISHNYSLGAAADKESFDSTH